MWTLQTIDKLILDRKGIEYSVSYLAYKEGTPEVDYQDSALRPCHPQNWQARSCPTEEWMKVNHRKSGGMM